MRGFFALLSVIFFATCTNSQLVSEDPVRVAGGSPAAGGASGGGGGKGGNTMPTSEVVVLPDASIVNLEKNDGGEAKVCGMPQFDLDRSPVDVLIVMDISGSLDNIVAGTGLTRWFNEYPAVLEVVKATEADLDWGLKMFPDKDGKQCLVRPGVDVPIAALNFKAIDAAIEPMKKMIKPPGNGTPTGDAIYEGIKYLKSLKATKPQYMVLATDGEPNCSVQGTGAPGLADIAAVQAAHDQGIDTFVIGVNDELKSNKTLTGMAVAGGRTRKVDPLVEPPFYVAEDKAGLVKAMNEIAGKLASCLFALASAPPSPQDVAADIVKKGTGKAERAPRDTSHTNGWDYTSSDHRAIEFYGSWCEKVQNVGLEGNTVKFTFGCPGVLIP